MDSIAGVITATSTDSTDSLCPSLTLKQRLFGCGCCLGLGLMFYIMAWISIMTMNITFFCIMVTFANVTLIAGLFFLAGPKSQFKRMFDEGRYIATIIFVLALVATILVAVLVKSVILTILMTIVQMGAMVWYYLSYIPFAREAVKSCFSGMTR